MPLYECAGNLHAHTRHSDGTGSHEDLVQAALMAGLDWLIVTDHNVRPAVAEGWREGAKGHRVLLLIGEEVHDTRRQPQASHLLCFGVRQDVNAHASDPQALIDAVNEQGGAAFFAHPVEHGTRMIDEELPWLDWDVQGYAGIEIWNYMSEFKSLTTHPLRAACAAFLPELFIRGPFPEALALWDRLSTERQALVVAIGGADAHAFKARWGPLRRTIFPYDFLFRTINMHVLTEEPLSGDLDRCRALLVRALRNGRCWVGYDSLAPTAGTRFYALQGDSEAQMGDSLPGARGPVTFHFAVPGGAELRLLRNGELIVQAKGNSLTHTDSHTGVYRAEAWRQAWGQRRAWVFANPIRVR
ncbi:MAG: CehA/McbA family metallohydrolase [Anaerolineae bacterium]|nr:CehA/McbA family metallohydrolase [Anaerolineae bacterium]